MPLLYDMDTGPIEIAKGRGDLRYSSVPSEWADLTRSILLAGDRRVSFARIFGEQSMVGAAVMWLLSQSVRVPLKVYRRTGDDSRERLREDDHRLAEAVADPWERGAPCQFTMANLGPMLVHGNAVTEIDEGARGRIRFVPTDYRFARPIMPWRNVIGGWEIDADDPSMTRTLPADTVLHVTWWSSLGPLGVSPLAQLGVTLNIEDAAQRHQKAMLSNGARPPSAITTTPEFLGLAPEERAVLMDQLRADVTAIYAGPDNAGRPAILPPGLDWKEVGHTAVEAELIRQREITREEIGAIYHLPPAVFGLGLDKSGNNLKDQREMAVADGLAPPLILVEQCINAQIIRALLRERDVYVEFDFGGILRPELLKEVEALRESIASALLTPNEARAIQNRPRSDVPAMDEFYLPRNNLVEVSVPYSGTPRGSGDE